MAQDTSFSSALSKKDFCKVSTSRYFMPLVYRGRVKFWLRSGKIEKGRRLAEELETIRITDFLCVIGNRISECAFYFKSLGLNQQEAGSSWLQSICRRSKCAGFVGKEGELVLMHLEVIARMKPSTMFLRC